jgi:hypothetical protein
MRRCVIGLFILLLFVGGGSAQAGTTPILAVAVDAGILLAPSSQLMESTVVVPVPPGAVLRGWQPWMGLDYGAVGEGGLRLHRVLADGTRVLLFRMSPHKEDGFVYYDAAPAPQYFPAGTGLSLAPGESLEMQLRCRTSGGAAAYRCAGKATLFFTAE